MHKKISITCLLVMMLIAVNACGSDTSADVAEPETPAVTEPQVEEAPAAASEEVSEPEEEPEEEIEEGKAYYTDEFTKADDYEKYGESGDAKNSDLIWIEGYVDEYNEDDKTLTLTAEEGEWSVSVGSAGTDYYYDLVEEAVDQKVRVFGVFTGYSDKLSMPTMAFQPKDYKNYAFRLESVDNEFRLTQLDYRFEEPDLDSEKAYGKLTFKESTDWEAKVMDDSLVYYFSDEIPALVMVHFDDATNTAGAQFDGLDEYDTLSSLVDSYVDSEEEIIRENPFTLEGYPALCFENTWTDDSLPMPMSLYCYMFIIDDEYYYFGCGEPYLVGESCKRLLDDMLEGFEVGDEIVAASAGTDDSKKDTKKSETEKAEEKTAEKTEAAKEAEAPKEAETKKSGFPTKDELLGKVFTQNVNLTLTGKNGEGTFSGSDTLPDMLVTADMLVNYNESTGVTSFTYTEDGDTVSTTMKFSYDANGKISYTGSISTDAAQYTGEGTVSGTQK